MNALTIPKLEADVAKVEADLADRCTPKDAAVNVAVILASYPQQKAHDPKTYVRQLTILLETYPASVAKELAHPVDGIVGRSVFLPAVAEVKEMADELVARRKGDMARALMKIRERQVAQAEAERERNLPSQEERERMAENLRRSIHGAADAITIN